MKKVLKIFSTALPLLILAFTSYGNNIRVKKLSLSDTIRTTKDIKIKFDLSWENSWRDDVNWDAAWIIVKVKRANGSWKHVKLQATGNSIDGNSQNAKIVVSDDKMGAFIYRSGNGSGNIDLSGIKLAWNYGVDSVANIDSAEIRLFATEMVYVPRGSFAFGDSYTPSATNMMMSYSSDRIVPSIFKNFISADTVKFGRNTPMFTIISDRTTPKLTVAATNVGPMNTGDQVIIDGIYINGLKGIGVTDSEPYKYTSFPVGYKAIYVMKYEVSQGQYTDFLNTTKIYTSGTHLPPGPSLLPVPMSPSQPLVRFSIEKQGENYIVSRPDRAMDYVNGTQLFAFANWSSLRPMTELEFEKAARGPLAPTYNDRANGPQEGHVMPGDNSNNVMTTVLKLNGPENGSEAPVISDSTKYLSNIMNIEGGDGGSGAYRVGIFATDKSSRKSSGASYYGIMGLTDNAGEFVVSLSSEVSRSFRDVNGLGENNPNGSPSISHWLNTTWIDTWSLMIFKNNWNGVSGRTAAATTGGFRLVRSAPSDL